MTAKDAYRLFLQSPEWHDLRRAKLDEAGHRCDECGETRRLQCHHTRYVHPWSATTLSDLRVLCRNCHAAVGHNFAEYDPTEELLDDDKIPVHAYVPQFKPKPQPEPFKPISVKDAGRFFRPRTSKKARKKARAAFQRKKQRLGWSF